MQATPQNDLLIWIQKLHVTCLTLNEQLIRSFELDNEPLLAGRDRFGFPGIAVRQKLMPRRGRIKEQPVTYHLHGTGITFVVEEQVNVSFEYHPRVSSVDTPILGAYGVREFIHSANPFDPLGNKEVIKEHTLKLIQEGTLGRVDNFFFQFYLVEPGESYVPMVLLEPC